MQLVTATNPLSLSGSLRARSLVTKLSHWQGLSRSILSFALGSLSDAAAAAPHANVSTHTVNTTPVTVTTSIVMLEIQVTVTRPRQLTSRWSWPHVAWVENPATPLGPHSKDFRDLLVDLGDPCQFVVSCLTRGAYPRYLF